MSLDTFNVTRLGIRNQKSVPGNTDDQANIMEEFSGEVETVAARKSVLQPHIKMRSVKGTSTLTNYAIGGTDLQVVVPGETPNGSAADISKASVVVDSLILARNTIPLLDVFQSSFDARRELAIEHGKHMAKFVDQALFIQAAKAAAMNTSVYGTDGFQGGTTVTLGAGASQTDPAVVYAAIAELFAEMEEKDIDPQFDDLVLGMRPDVFYALIQAEQVVNGEYVTADGNKMNGYIFKAFGVPVVRSNNIPNSVITNHKMSNARNSNAYDGDFSKLVALAFSPRALLAGETIPLTSKVFFDEVSKHWYVDTWTSFGVTPNRPEYSGRIILP